MNAAAEGECAALRLVIAGFGNQTAPSNAEKRLLWVSAFELYRDKLAAGAALKKLRRSLVNFLSGRAPWLASSTRAGSPHALRTNFQRKYAEWLAAGCPPAIGDRRSTDSGNWRAPGLGEADRGQINRPCRAFLRWTCRAGVARID